MPDSTTTLDQLRAKICCFPKSPGVYLMKDAKGVVLYVGKAKDLRSRVGSYFQPSADLLASRGPEIARMVCKLRSSLAWPTIVYLPCSSGAGASMMKN